MSKSVFEKCYDKHYDEWREIYDSNKEIDGQCWLAALRWVLRRIDKGASGEQCGYILNDAVASIRAEIKKLEAK